MAQNDKQRGGSEPAQKPEDAKESKNEEDMGEIASLTESFGAYTTDRTVMRPLIDSWKAWSSVRQI